jgi:rod shape-determining protein MreD
VNRAPALRVTLKLALVLVVAILAQTSFGPDLRVDEVAPDFMLLVAVVAGFIGGADTGALVGFASGAVADLFLQSTPFGLSCLAFCLTGFIVGAVASVFLRPHWWLVPIVSAAGTVVGVVLFVIIGYLVGEAQLAAPGKEWLVQVGFVEALYAAVLGLPAATVVGWALTSRAPRRPSAAVPTGVGPAEMAPRRRPSARSRRRRRARVGAR